MAVEAEALLRRNQKEGDGEDSAPGGLLGIPVFQQPVRSRYIPDAGRIYYSPWASSQLRSSAFSTTQHPVTGSGLVRLRGT